MTCQEAMTKELKEWASNVGGNVSFCPCCRTKIEKSMGCNHMTCWFCQYEFCWACGESATGGDGHWSGSGCGVGMMDSNIRPGDHLKMDTCWFKVKKFFRGLGIGLCFLLAFIIIYPFWLVFAIPFVIAVSINDKSRSNGDGILLKSIKTLLGFCLGLVLDICFIPAALIFTVCVVAAGIIGGIAGLVKWCTTPARTRRELDPEQV